MSGIEREKKDLLAELQEPLPVVLRPFKAVADRAGVREEEVLERVRAWLADGTIRRFGARVRHLEMGYTANGMSVWRAAPEKVDEVAGRLAERPEVSHCYLRRPQPGWEYNLYAMIHGRTEEEVRAVAEEVARRTGVEGFEILFSVREFKKTTPRYGRTGD